MVAHEDVYEFKDSPDDAAALIMNSHIALQVRASSSAGCAPTQESALTITEQRQALSPAALPADGQEVQVNATCLVGSWLGF